MQISKLQSNLFKIIFCFGLLTVMNGCAAKSLLMQASAQGDYQTVQKLIQEGVNVNEADSNGSTALMYAISKRKVEVAKYLIGSGADLKAKDKHGYDALIYAVENRQIEIMKILIDKGADVDSRDMRGNIPLYPPLYYAIGGGFTKGVKLLVKNGANVHAKTNEDNQKTILDYALYYGQMDVAASLGDKLWEPDAGKARIFLIGEELYDYISVKIGNHSKYLKRASGFSFIDIEPGNHAIAVGYVDTGKAKPTLSIDTMAGQTYYFKITQNITNRIVGYAIVVSPTLVDRVTGTTPFAITPLKKSEAKEKIKALLQSKELTEVKKPIDAEVEKNSSDSSGYAQKLRELKKLKDEGLLTDKEYEQKRKAIVDSM